MKILTERLNSEPKHSVTKKDIKAILQVVPEHWVGVAHTFSISAQLYKNSKWPRPVIQNGVVFKILSRGLDKKMVIKELLIELAIRPTITSSGYAHSLTKVQRKKLEETIEPYYRQLEEDGLFSVNPT